MNSMDAAAYYRGRALSCRLLADQAEAPKLAALYRELAAVFEKEADSRDGGSLSDGGELG